MSGNDWVGSQGDAPPDGHQMPRPSRGHGMTRPSSTIREITWVAREARAIADEGVQPGSERWEAYMARKAALMAEVESA